MSLDRSEFDTVWAKYVEIGSWEKHFNELQVKYRTIVSIWLIATVSGLGFIFATEDGFPLSKFFSAALVLFVSAFGVFIVWILDILVYHRLLDAYFYEGRKLEMSFDWLPQARRRLSTLSEGSSNKNKGILYRTAIFYASVISSTIYFGMAGFLAGVVFKPGFVCRDLFLGLCYSGERIPIGNPHLSAYFFLFAISISIFNYGLGREIYYRLIKKSMNPDLKR